MTDRIKEFSQTVQHSARNPLGIIALFLVLVYGMAALVVGASGLDPGQRQIIVWFLVIFPILVLAVFYRLVTKHHNKLYAPSDFADEANFMKTLEAGLERSPKFSNLENSTENVRKQIEEQPLYRYTRLSEAGKRLILMTNKRKSVDLLTFSEEKKLQLDELKTQAQILAEDYGWINIEGDIAKITEKGKVDLTTFEDFVYGRVR